MHIAVRDLFTLGLSFLGLSDLPSGQPYSSPHPTHKSSSRRPRTSSSTPVCPPSTAASPVISSSFTSTRPTTPFSTSRPSTTSTPKTTPKPTLVATPVLPSTKMFCLSGTLTSTLTLFVTLTSGFPQEYPVIPSAIEGLSDCAQSVVFPLLAGSQCNPADFPCICTELTRFQAEAAISAACDDDEVSGFQDFQDGQCRNQVAVQPASVPTSTPTAAPATVSTSTASSTKATTSTTTSTFKPVVPLTTSNVTIPVVINSTNGTVVGPVAPPVTPAVVVIPTTVGPADVGGAGSGGDSGAAAGPTYVAAAGPGAEVPGFGVWGMGTGLFGLMVLAFAEL